MNFLYENTLYFAFQERKKRSVLIRIDTRGGQWMIKKETIGEEGGDKLYKEDS